MAKVRIKHLYIPLGTTYVYEVTYVDSRNEPIPLSGYKARLQFRDTVDDPFVLYDATTENGRLEFDLDEGIIRLTIPVTDNTFTWTQAVYDLEVITPVAEQVFRLVKGTVDIDKDVTR